MSTSPSPSRFSHATQRALSLFEQRVRLAPHLTPPPFPIIPSGPAPTPAPLPPLSQIEHTRTVLSLERSTRPTSVSRRRLPEPTNPIRTLPPSTRGAQ